jgi:hypothetical protein
VLFQQPWIAQGISPLSRQCRQGAEQLIIGCFDSDVPFGGA